MTDVDAYRDAEYIADVSGISNDDTELLRPIGTLRSQNARVKNVKSAAKVAFIDRLLRDLDILIYCQLSALYYMDCSIVLFAIRAIVELIFFTPKAPPFEPTRSQPFVSAIIGSNLICMLFHAFLICPEAGEETRGYLHGGLFIDFIGQTPVSVYRLLSFDFLIFLIDIIMLGLIIERVKTNGTPAPAPATSTPDTHTDTSPNTEDSQPQDHDAEERGILRQEDGDETTSAVHNSPDSHYSSGIDEEVEEERTTLLADPADAESGSGARGEHPMDTFAAGEAVIVNMSFLGTLSDQWCHSNSVVRSTPGFVPSPETATFLRQRFGLQVGTNGRIERANTT
ncbi:Peptidase M18 [Penicillium digitatum]|uniref:DUF1746 domain-containing protein n=3 Tax=Penicillium digitatum TaxID=36651 RepID=K9G579_PEND2|nr:hypothetical protein PDIP_00180 [Penicillium digitatum Pd1]EKV16569.1 hypothetical protein PDIG_20420 [Penicillium digitatum PHI26]EKV22064.1 hypothetical protein PDIP_00180 [Penicillium digitatum Pd1]KAG0154348.1 hypothetical protein PDIDSM_1728 [Penicillium digitatum]QQK47918.1 Peptidase M18 [Penicillium digitatum]